jgi:hypothetical protein
MQLGIMRIEIEFSGGNDEGGADDVTAYDPEGKVAHLPRGNAFHSTQKNPETGQWEPGPWQVWEQGKPRDATPEEIAATELMALLETPIYDEYHGFAGDFYVNGKVIWDVGTGSVIMERNEEVKDYVYSELEL